MSPRSLRNVPDASSIHFAMLRYSEALEVGWILDDIVGDMSAVQPSGGATRNHVGPGIVPTSPNIQGDLEQED